MVASDTATILAYRSRTGKRRVHFITTLISPPALPCRTRSSLPAWGLAMATRAHKGDVVTGVDGFDRRNTSINGAPVVQYTRGPPSPRHDQGNGGSCRAHTGLEHLQRAPGVRERGRRGR